MAGTSILPNESIEWLKAAIAREESSYAAANPKSSKAYSAACAYMPGGNTRATVYYPPFPLAIERGENGKLYDADGHEYLNFVGEYTAGVYGNDASMLSTVLAAIGEHGTLLGGPTEHEAKLAELICKRWGYDKIRFCNTGTESNLLAVGLARNVTGKPGILSFNHAYHGGAMVFMDGPGPLNAPFDVTLSDYNDIEGTKAIIEANADKLAAIILEPMMGAGGCIPADVEFLQMLRDMASAHNIVLIFDEVMTSRLSPGGLQARVGVKPDLTTMGKYLGGGFSFGAVGGRAELMNRFDPSKPGALSHGGTFNNNIASMIAGYIGLSEYFTEEACIELNARGDVMRERLNDFAAAAGVPVQATGVGSLIALHLCAGKIRRPADTASPGSAEFKRLYLLYMLNRGFYVTARGMLTLNLHTTEGFIDAYLKAYIAFLDEFGPALTEAISATS